MLLRNFILKIIPCFWKFWKRFFQNWNILWIWSLHLGHLLKIGLCCMWNTINNSLRRWYRYLHRKKLELTCFWDDRLHRLDLFLITNRVEKRFSLVIPNSHFQIQTVLVFPLIIQSEWHICDTYAIITILFLNFDVYFNLIWNSVLLVDTMLGFVEPLCFYEQV